MQEYMFIILAVGGMFQSLEKKRFLFLFVLDYDDF